MDCSIPGSSVLHYLPEFAQIHVHLVTDAIQPSHPLSPPSPSEDLQTLESESESESRSVVFDSLQPHGL